MYTQAPQYPSGLKYHTKKQCQAFISSKNSNCAEKSLHVTFWGYESTQRHFPCCTLYKFINRKVTAIKPNPVIQLINTAQKMTWRLDPRRRNTSVLYPVMQSRNHHRLGGCGGGREEVSLPSDLCRMPQVRGPK